MPIFSDVLKRFGRSYNQSVCRNLEEYNFLIIPRVSAKQYKSSTFPQGLYSLWVVENCHIASDAS